MAMTKTEYRASIKALGLSQRKAAGFLGISFRQSRRLATGDYSPSLSAEKLLRMMLELGLTPQIVNEINERGQTKPSKAKKKRAAATA